MLLVSCGGNHSKKISTTELNQKPLEKNIAKKNSTLQLHANHLTYAENETISLAEGTFLTRPCSGLQQEKLPHQLTAKPHSIDKSPVNIAQSSILIISTDYKTEAEWETAA
jgi:formylglycine-generating enzyme required for sulfatase activity